MRYPKEHKEKSRNLLLESGGRHAKRHGFAGSGMQALAAAGGVTTGSLYKHFGGKSDLFAALIGAELARTVRRFSALAPGDRAAARKALAAYLSPDHVNQPEAGCALPSLAPEVARADESVQDAFQDGLLEVQSVIAERITGCGDAAWALIAQSVGAVMLARAVPDERIRRELLGAATKAGAALLGKSAGRESARAAAPPKPRRLRRPARRGRSAGNR